MPRFVIQRERTQIHRTIVDAPTRAAAEAFADQDFDEDEYEQTEYDRVIVEAGSSYDHVIPDVAFTRETCQCCGSLTPWRCDCQICRTCENEYSPATSDAKSPQFWCSRDCEEEAAEEYA